MSKVSYFSEIKHQCKVFFLLIKYNIISRSDSHMEWKILTKNFHKAKSNKSSPPSGLPWDSVVKNLPAYAWDAGSIPESGEGKCIPGEGNGNPLQYSCLGNPMHRGAWRDIVHGVTKDSVMT